MSRLLSVSEHFAQALDAFAQCMFGESGITEHQAGARGLCQMKSRERCGFNPMCLHILGNPHIIAMFARPAVCRYNGTRCRNRLRAPTRACAAPNPIIAAAARATW